MATSQEEPKGRPEAKPEPSRGRGRPRKHERGYPTSVVLGHGLEKVLDDLVYTIRARTGSRIGRSEVIRGCVHGVLRAGVDLSEAKDEDEVERLVRAHVGGEKPTRRGSGGARPAPGSVKGGK